MGEVIVKLNDGVSGTGNALVELAGIADLPARRASRRDPRARSGTMQFESPSIPFDGTSRKLASDGGIVEERIVGEDLLSPSVQLRVRPDGSVELLSTHDQLLGGAERAELPRLHVPRRPGVLPTDQRTGNGDRRSGWPARA